MAKVLFVTFLGMLAVNQLMCSDMALVGEAGPAQNLSGISAPMAGPAQPPKGSSKKGLAKKTSQLETVYNLTADFKNNEVEKEFKRMVSRQNQISQSTRAQVASVFRFIDLNINHLERLCKDDSEPRDSQRVAIMKSITQRCQEIRIKQRKEHETETNAMMKKIANKIKQLEQASSNNSSARIATPELKRLNETNEMKVECLDPMYDIGNNFKKDNLGNSKATAVGYLLRKFTDLPKVVSRARDQRYNAVKWAVRLINLKLANAGWKKYPKKESKVEEEVAQQVADKVNEEVAEAFDDVSEDVVDQIDEVEDEVSENIEDGFDDASEQIEDVKEEASETIEDVKEDVEEGAEEGDLDEVKDDAAEEVDEVADDANEEVDEIADEASEDIEDIKEEATEEIEES